MNPQDQNRQDILNRVQALAQTGDYEEIEDLLKSLIVADPQDRDARLFLGITLTKTGKLKEGIAELNFLLKEHAHDLEILSALAQSYYLQENLPAALGTFTEAAELNPSQIKFYYYIGTIQKKLGNFKAASMAYARAIELDAGYVPGYNNLGIVYVTLQEHTKALHILQQALALEADNPILHFNYGVVLQNLERFKAAFSAYRKALEYKPQWDAALNNMGIIFFKHGQRDKAQQAFTTILKSDPRNCRAQNNMGVILLDQGQTQEAIQYFKQALGADPEYEKALGNLNVECCVMRQTCQTAEQGEIDHRVQLFDGIDMIPMVDEKAESLKIPVDDTRADSSTSDKLDWDFTDIEQATVLNLLKYLIYLAEYLPPEAKEQFIESDTQSGLNYIIGILEK